MSNHDDPTIVGVSGSRRDGSYTRIALQQAIDQAAETGATVEIIDLRELALPLYHPDQGIDGGAAEMCNTIETADAVILATPMYHGSYSSTIKNALDYCGFDEFENKTVGLLAVSGGSFPITALEHLRTVCRSLNAWVLPYQAAVPNSSNQFDNGNFVDEKIKDRVETLGDRIVRYSRIQELDPRSFESQENVGADD